MVGTLIWEVQAPVVVVDHCQEVGPGSASAKVLMYFARSLPGLDVVGFADQLVIGSDEDTVGVIGLCHFPRALHACVHPDAPTGRRTSPYRPDARREVWEGSTWRWCG
jgi:hypothetical protein